MPTYAVVGPAPNTAPVAAEHRAIAFLAEASSLPFEQVAQIYAREKDRLERSARVKKFLPIFTFRNVQEALRLLRKT